MNDFPKFQHEAMATTFEIVIAGRPPEYARQAAAAAFRELDQLEDQLSRYRESSDIGRVNQLAEGESVRLGEHALQCLLTALQISALTQRAFDPAYATARPLGSPPDAPLFALDPASHTLASLVPRLQIDLGAVGKGYALDCLADVLREWDIASACLQSGGSTALALAAPDGVQGWEIGVGSRRVVLANFAVSGSGLAVQGEHLIDPRRGGAAKRVQRAWAFAKTAAESDALSTAFFVMSDAEVADFCRLQPEYGAALARAHGREGESFFGRVPDLTAARITAARASV
jgi:thiamine biosynthesis lipoprotein